MSTNRPSARVGLWLGVAGISLCALCAIAGFSSLSGPGDVGAAPSGMTGDNLPARAQAVSALTGFTPDRLATEVADKYGFHFMSAAAPADPGGVDMSTAQDAGGDQLRVILFGRAPDPVHAVSCEISPPQAAATATATLDAAVTSDAILGFLGACARTAVGGDQATAVARWLTVTQAALAAEPATGAGPGRLTRSAGFSSIHYAVRRIPDTGEWIMSMTGSVS